jgi:hypothetical protein
VKERDDVMWRKREKERNDVMRRERKREKESDGLMRRERQRERKRGML